MINKIDVEISTPNTEVSVVVPKSTKSIFVQNNTASILYMAWISGEVAGNRNAMSVSSGKQYGIVELSFTEDSTLYLAAKNAIGKVEVTFFS